MSLISILTLSTFDLLLSIFKDTDLALYFYYPKYVFLTVTYFIFLASSYQILSIGKVFGFNKAAENIKKVMKNKRSKV